MSINLARIEAFLFRAEVKEPVKTSFGSIPRRSVLLLRVEDAEGAHGWGEIWCNFPPFSADNKMRLLETVICPAALSERLPRSGGCMAHADRADAPVGTSGSRTGTVCCVSRRSRSRACGISRHAARTKRFAQC